MHLVTAVNSYLALNAKLPLTLRQQQSVVRRDAYWLLAHTCEMSVEELIRAGPHFALNSEQSAVYLTALTELAKGTPLAYVLGEWGFYDEVFYVTSEVLIPRPETESLVDWVLTAYPSRPALQVLEIGCGSGALALSLKLKRPQWEITATDLSLSALALTKRNCQKLNCQLQLVHSDLFKQLPASASYALIIANLPYLSRAELAGLPALAAEPELALTDQQDGLQLITKLYAAAHHYLIPAGCLVVEHGQLQAAAVARLAEELGYVKPQIIYDLSQRPRGLAVRSTA